MKSQPSQGSGISVPAALATDQSLPFSITLKNAERRYGDPVATLRDRWYHSKPRVVKKGVKRGTIIPANGFAPAFVKSGRSLRLLPQKYEALVMQIDDRQGGRDVS